MRIKVILNPWSDRGQAMQYEDTIEVSARQYGELDIVLTERPGHAQELARQAADAGYDLVVAAGGDGTIHEVVNGLVWGGQANARLGIIPIGSGNDLAYTLGMATDAETAVQRLFTGQPQTIDLARIEDDRGRYRIFGNGVGIGFDATIAIQAEGITRIRGFPMYALATLRTIAFYYRTPHCQIHFDDESISQDVLLLAVGVGKRAGGGFLLTPDAAVNDDFLDSCTVNPVGRLTMLNMLPRVMKGTHVTSKHVTMRKSRRIHIKSNMPLPIHIDGEIFAYPKNDVREVTVTSLPAAIEVII
jgi:YegS/Rv2252/BmrU family lipid kinase